jgi:hypothetical protein
MDAALAARLLVKPGAALGSGAVYEPARSQVQSTSANSDA